MKSVRTFSTELEAHVAKIALDAAGVPSVVVGIGLSMEGGDAGVQILVPEHFIDAALRVLDGPPK